MKDKRIAFDLDGVIATIVRGSSNPVVRYRQAKPIEKMIKVVNSLFDEGNYIIIYTARGMSTYSGDSSLAYHHLFSLTREQLKEWGVKYHQLVMGKIHYDVLIDDKAINSFSVESSENILEFVDKR